MSSRPHTAIYSRNPVPGAYIFSMITKPSAPNYRIGSAKREIFNVLESNPGPAQYSRDSFIAYTRPKPPNWKIGSSPRELQILHS